MYYQQSLFYAIYHNSFCTFLPLPQGQGSFLPTFGSLFIIGSFEPEVLGAFPPNSFDTVLSSPSPVIFY